MLRLLGIAICLLGAFTGQTQAQIVLDGTTGTSGPLVGPDYQITDTIGKKAGSNLFHSFEVFNVLEGESATFTGPVDLNNVISRVTGGDVSNIDGRLDSHIPGADFWFINPAGVVFGANAEVNVPGAFLISSAPEIQFSDGNVFSATLPGASTFTAASPEAFGFLGNAAGAISVEESFLDLSVENNFALVGGPVDIVGGQVFAGSAAVNLVSIAGPGSVAVQNNRVIPEPTQERGSITLSESFVEVSDSDAAVRVIGGDILIEDSLIVAAADSFSGSAIEVDAEALTMNGGLLESSTFSEATGGDVRLSAVEELNLIDTFVSVTGENNAGNVLVESPKINVTSSFFLAESQGVSGGNFELKGDEILIADSAILTVNSGSGPAGSATIEANRLEMTDGTFIITETDGDGRGGDITIEVVGDVVIEESLLSGATSSFGMGGNISITSNTLTMAVNAPVIQTSSTAEGNAGDVALNVTELMSLSDGTEINSETTGTGAGGSVRVVAGDLDMGDGSQISADTFGSGPGGEVDLRISGSLTLSGESLDQVTAVSTGSEGEGDAGTLSIEAETIEVGDRARIGVGTVASGAGGSADIDAGSIVVTGGAQITSRSSSTSVDAGSAGTLSIKADQLQVVGAEITANTVGPGHGGGVELNAGILTLDGAGRITSASASTAANAGDAGSIGIAGLDGTSAADSIILLNGEITTSTSGGGRGGSIDIRTTDLQMSGGSSIASSAAGSGPAGTLSITADNLRVAENSQIAASTSATGAGGNVSLKVANSTVESGGEITSSSTGTGANSGDAGSVTVAGLASPAETIMIIGGRIVTSTSGGGRGGSIDVEGNNVQLTQGAAIESNTTSSGDAGTLTVKAGNLMVQDGSSIAAATSGTGTAGNVNLRVSAATVESGAQVTSSSLSTLADGGDAGAVTITGLDDVSPSLILIEGAVATSTSGGGKGGNIAISVETLDLMDNSRIVSSAEGPGDAGTLLIEGGSIHVSESRVAASTSGRGKGGNVELKIGSLRVVGTGEITSSSTGTGQDSGDAGSVSVGGFASPAQLVSLDDGQISTSTRGGGLGGRIDIEADIVELSNRSDIASETEGSGDAGALSIKALEINVGQRSRIAAGTSGTGAGGSVNLDVGNLIVDGLGQVASSSSGLGEDSGDAGRVTITGLAGPAQRLELTHGEITTNTSGGGTGGDIEAAANEIFLTDSARITSNAQGSGEAGSLRIRANQLQISDDSQVAANTAGTGAGGNVDLAVEALVVNGGGEIASSSTGTGEDSGDAGSVLVSGLMSPAASVVIDGGSIATGTQGGGEGGSIRVAADDIELRNRAVVSSQSNGIGNAGAIELIATKKFFGKNSSVETDAAISDGGNINITAQKKVELRKSQVNASVGGGVETTGGNITIGEGKNDPDNPGQVILDSSDVVAQAGEGAGGRIDIFSDLFVASADSLVSASSESGIDGEVNIEAAVANLAATLVPLPDDFLDATALLREPCAARHKEGRASSLIFRGRDRVPLEPGDLLPSRPTAGAKNTSERSTHGPILAASPAGGVSIYSDERTLAFLDWNCSRYSALQ